MVRLRRFLVFMVGVVVLSLGIALMKHAGLGISPISSVSNTLSEITSLTLGQWTMIFYIFLLVVQIILLGKKFPWLQLAQIPLAIFSGYIIDGFTSLVTLIPVDNYLMQVLIFTVGLFVMSFGIYLEVNSNQPLLLPGEGIVKAIHIRFDILTTKAKVRTDLTMITISAIIGLVSSGQLIGIREGTIISALLVGRLVSYFESKYPLMEYI